MIVNSGLNLIRGFLNGDVPNVLSHMAVGTGSTAVAAGNTTLETETIRSFLTPTKQSTDGVIDYTMTVPSTEGNGTTLSEVGVFNASTGGDMLSRQVHSGYSKTDNFSVKYKITHTLSDV